MKLHIAVISEIEVTQEELKTYYEAHTIGQAAFNQQKWFQDGSSDISEFIMNADNVQIVVTGIK